MLNLYEPFLYRPAFHVERQFNAELLPKAPRAQFSLAEHTLKSPWNLLLVSIGLISWFHFLLKVLLFVLAQHSLYVSQQGKPHKSLHRQMWHPKG